MKPTRDQAKEAWESIAEPSSRIVADLLKQRGFDVSFRTIARWKDRDWREGAVTPRPEGRVNKELTKALKTIPPDQIDEAGKVAAGGLHNAVAGGALGDADYARIQKREGELKLLSQAELEAQEKKTRKIMNIVLMEEATRRAHIMVLIPKDTGSLVGAMTEAAKVTISGGDGQVPDVNDPRVINGESRRVEDEPENPIASAIGKFLAKENAA